MEHNHQQDQGESSHHDHRHQHSETCKHEEDNHSVNNISHNNNNHDHGHQHEHLHDAGKYIARAPPKKRKYSDRAFTVGIGGPVGSGKTALMLKLCLQLQSQHNLCAVTNDIFTKEDGEFLIKNKALNDTNRIVAVETGGCPHAAIREDITANLIACEELTDKFKADLILLESGGDNLAADFSRDLADFTIYIIDVAGGDKVPRKGGPGITQSDLLVINKTDLAEAVGASLEVMKVLSLMLILILTLPNLHPNHSSFFRRMLR